MDPVSAAGLAIGVASIGLQIYTGCIQGIQLLITAQNFPEECKYLNLRLRMEQQRLFAWSETSGLLDLELKDNKKILRIEHLHPSPPDSPRPPGSDSVPLQGVPGAPKA